MQDYSVKTGLVETYDLDDQVKVKIYQNSDNTFDIEFAGTVILDDGQQCYGKFEFLRAKEKNIYLTEFVED